MSSVRSFLTRHFVRVDHLAQQRHDTLMSKLTDLQVSLDKLTAAVAARPALDDDPRLDALKVQVDAATAALTPAAPAQQQQ